MKTKLKIRQVKECLVRNPVISSVEEMCAVLNVDMDRVAKSELEAAAKVIERNRLRLQVNLKTELYAGNQKSKELLYKMVCLPDELPRFGIKAEGNTTNNITPTIVVKSEDPDILDKIQKL